MIRRLTISSVLACVALSVALHAETVSQREAKVIASTFFNAVYGEVTKEPKLLWNGRQLTTDHLFSPFFVFNHDRGGYVIISGENKAFPILAYSTKRKFDRSSLSDTEKEWLKKYAREIELIRYDPRQPVSAIEAWQDIRGYIAKMITSPYTDNQQFTALENEDREELENLDRSGNQILMPSAVEFQLFDKKRYRDINLDDVTADEHEGQYIPFSFFENFIKEINEEKAAAEKEFELSISEEKPIITALGSGSYQISFPENIRLAKIYSMQGLQIGERYFKESHEAFINLEGEQRGYYVAMILSDTGKTYGIKLAR